MSTTSQLFLPQLYKFICKYQIQIFKRDFSQIHITKKILLNENNSFDIIFLKKVKKQNYLRISFKYYLNMLNLMNLLALKYVFHVTFFLL